jgi:hypothetical protein
MIWHRTSIALCGLSLALGASACDNNKLTAVNKNPNAPEQVSASLLFPTAAVSSIRRIRSDLEITPSAFVHWPQYAAEYQYPEISYYQFRPTTADGWFNAYYTGPLQDLAQALRQTTAANHPNETGPILVLRAFNYSTLTGFWGDIPFSQAGQGDKGIITPVYDKQQVVYDSLLKNLADANAMMGPTAGLTFETQDPVYGGDMVRWKKFANSLRARLGMNLSRIDANRAKSEVAAAIAAGGFADNSDNAQITWPGDGTNNNPWWDTEKDGQGTRDDTRMSSTFIDTLKSLSDPRLQVFARPVQDPSCTAGGAAMAQCTVVAAGGYRGQPNGLEAGDAGNRGPKASRLGPQVFAEDQPSYFMTYAEYSFIKAEAAERGWIAGSAAQFYTEGVTASLEQWGVSASAITAYLAQPRITYTPGAAGLAQIGLQKWIALFTQGFEAWSEWRRTGFPNLTPVPNARTADKQIPRRIIYPQTEQSFNNANLQAAISAQGGSDALNKHLWIDP